MPKAEERSGAGERFASVSTRVKVVVSAGAGLVLRRVLAVFPRRGPPEAEVVTLHPSDVEMPGVKEAGAQPLEGRRSARR